VKTHLLHVFDKLAVSDRTAAVTTAMRLGVLRDGDR
jgi:ATP/maltotriose-dependent transcriptional regulator MalT